MGDPIIIVNPKDAPYRKAYKAPNKPNPDPITDSQTNSPNPEKPMMMILCFYRDFCVIVLWGYPVLVEHTSKACIGTSWSQDKGHIMVQPWNNLIKSE